MTKNLKNIHNSHDIFIKSILKNPKDAINFFENYLPKDLVEIMDLNSLKLEDSSFTTENFEELHSDILYRVKLKNKLVRIYLLFEHKSQPDKWTGLQVLKYMVEKYDKERIEILKDKSTCTRKLTPIIPYVFYHGETDWKYATNFSSIIRMDEVYEKYIVDFNYILQNITIYGDKELLGNEVIKTTLLVMKHIWDKDIMKIIKYMIENNMLCLDNLGEYAFRRIVTYILENKNVNEKDVFELLKTKKLEKEASEMLTTAERLRQEGRKEAESKIRKMITNLIKEGYDKLKIKELSGLSDRELNRLLPKV